MISLHPISLHLVSLRRKTKIQSGPGRTWVNCATKGGSVSSSTSFTVN